MKHNNYKIVNQIRKEATDKYSKVLTDYFQNKDVKFSDVLNGLAHFNDLLEDDAYTTIIDFCDSFDNKTPTYYHFDVYGNSSDAPTIGNEDYFDDEIVNEYGGVLLFIIFRKENSILITRHFKPNDGSEIVCDFYKLIKDNSSDIIMSCSCLDEEDDKLFGFNKHLYGGGLSAHENSEYNINNEAFKDVMFVIDNIDKFKEFDK